MNEGIMEIMRSRHSVRQYLDKPIPREVRDQLDAFAAELNRESGLNMQILYDEPECFNSRLARYGRFENAKNYIALVGRKGESLEERCGYYGEKLVLRAQELGLNTCWVALTHGKSRAVVAPGEREVIIISLGYGRTQGSPRRSKSAAEVSDASAADAPEWYRRGVEAALLAPTAVNQQRFRFERSGDRVTARAGRLGTNLKVDLGIVKCHFALAAGEENFTWA
ncbi:MAG: nitroreductase family protein [Clostridia bacterium]|nr:nitroreductase family protein [Clostridia bacterium]